MSSQKPKKSVGEKARRKIEANRAKASGKVPSGVRFKSFRPSLVRTFRPEFATA